MREVRYETFSLKTHQKNWKINRPNTCQFELTFGCALHCRHCYTDCYNKPRYIKNELNTKEVKYILNKVYRGGVVWLCFTGGDPLSREDFLEIYSYAKDRGFIITIFTNGYSMNKEIVGYFRKKSPFVIEMTLNAVTKNLYERIAQVKDSFEKAIKGINLILQANLPLKIKTQVTRDNIKELPKIENFIKGLGLGFRPSVFLHARLDGDLAPCHLRISPQDVLKLGGRRISPDDNCIRQIRLKPSTSLFRCAIVGEDGIHIDPFGNIVPCDCIRIPKVNLVKSDLEKAQKRILNWTEERTYTYNSKCRDCAMKEFCFNCPGKAWLEKRNLEGIVDWFCEMAHLEFGQIQ